MQAPPRVLVAPPGARTNAWQDVSDLSSAFGLDLYPWQNTVLHAAMGERADGKWAAQRVGLSVPRQNGKSQLIVARALAGALLFDERLIVISAHQADTARETFEKFLVLIDDSPALASRIAPAGVMNAVARERIKFRNGATIKFKARTGPGGRGFSADALFLDEAQRLPARAWASINSTMSARRNPQVWLLGTPPTPDDDGAVFASVRRSAIDGKSDRAAYAEWSSYGDPALEATRAEANPAWYDAINHDVVEGEFETYTPEQFAQERLGQWSEVQSTDVIDLVAWESRKAPAADVTSPVVLAVETTLDRAQSVVVAVGSRPDDTPQAEVAAQGPGTSWVAGEVVRMALDNDDVAAIVVDDRSPAKPLAESIQAALEAAELADVDLVVTSSSDMAEACAQVLDAINDGQLVHLGDPVMLAAVKAAVRRDIGDGAWAWSRRKGGAAVAPLVAMTIGLWAWRQLAGNDYDVTASLG